MKFRIVLFLLAMLGINSLSFAQGDLLVTPTRVVFEGQKQKETLNLVNMGKDTTTYTISFLQYNMMEDGHFVIIDNSDVGEFFADPYLKIFPRKVTLAPGEPQAVMLQCRRKFDMMPGEYRSHLYFRSEKKIKPLGSEVSDTTLVSVNIIPVYGMSIPVIIRSGNVNVSSTLSDLRLDVQQGINQNLLLTINRIGNMSAYGDVVVQYFPLQGKPYEIGAMRGVGVYTNINKRNIVLKLNNTSGKPLINGKLKVQYISNGDKKRVVFAEQELDVR